MASPKISMRNKGFTLLETMITLTILSVLATLGALMSADAFTAYVHRSDRDEVVALLEEARSFAMQNFYQTTSGVCVDDASHYVLFRGAYAPSVATNEYTDMSPQVVASSSPPRLLCQYGGIVFTELSATTSSTTVYLLQNNATSTISINYEGTISW